MNAHWPKHKVYHKVQKERAMQALETELENGQLDRTRSLAEEVARRAEETGSEYDKRFAEALALGVRVDFHGAAKAWRKIIKQWPHRPAPHFNLALVLQRSTRFVEAAQMFLKAMELHEDGTKQWGTAAAESFDLLKTPDCRDAPKPEWWNDEGLKALSAQVVALVPDGYTSCAMRARVLCGDALGKEHTAPWNAGPRTAAEVKDAATWYRRAARVSVTAPVDTQRDELHASWCDEFADPLLAQEEAEAAKARAAADAEAAKALKVAEAKAAAAAEELLAEEEKESQQASIKASKAKQSKGKKGIKGKR